MTGRGTVNTKDEKRKSAILLRRHGYLVYPEPRRWAECGHMATIGHGSEWCYSCYLEERKRKGKGI